MDASSDPCRLYLVTPPAIDLARFPDLLAAALDAGDVAAVQLRLKDAPERELMRAIDTLRPVAQSRGVAFLLNDRPDLAAASGCDGAHVGQADMQAREARRLLGGATLGVTCHDSRDLAMKAGEDGADYVAFGAFFPTATKEAPTRADPAILRWWSELMQLPCVAIGGIAPGNCAPLVRAGADFLAVVGAVWAHQDGPAQGVRAMNAAIEAAAQAEAADDAASVPSYTEPGPWSQSTSIRPTTGETPGLNRTAELARGNTRRMAVTDGKMMAQMSSGPGFIAALDQSGGSTPGALRLYGVPDDAYHGEEQMFRLIHDMRVRIISAPAFTGAKVIGTILFEATMDGEAEGTKVPTYLWRDRGVVPFLKVDKGLAPEQDGVQLMKPIPDLDPLCARAASLGVFGTKMRSVIGHASQSGIAAIVAQQFDFAQRILRHGLMPIIEPEVSIKAPDKADAETMLRDEISRHLDDIPDGEQVMLKLTIPDRADLYQPLIDHDRVARVVALSGGYNRDEACEKLSHNHGMIASFSRALIEDLRQHMSDAEFDAALGRAIEQIFAASTVKH